MYYHRIAVICKIVNPHFVLDILDMIPLFFLERKYRWYYQSLRNSQAMQLFLAAVSLKECADPDVIPAGYVPVDAATRLHWFWFRRQYRYVQVCKGDSSNQIKPACLFANSRFYVYIYMVIRTYIYINSYLESHSAIVVLFQRPWIFSWSLRLWSSGAAFGGDDLTEHYFFPWPEHVWLLVFQVYIQWWYMHIYVWYDMIWYDMIVYIYRLYLYLHYDDGMMIYTYDIIYIYDYK